MTSTIASADRPSAQGPAFPVCVRVLATVLVAGVLYWGLYSAGPLLRAEWTFPSALLLIATLGLVLWCLAWMWRSRTQVDAVGVQQSWIWTKQVRWADVAQARLVGVRGLEWLITPRLVVRPRGGGILVFHSADARVLAAFASFVTIGSPLLEPSN